MANKPKTPGDPNLSEKIWQTGWTYIRHVVDTAREPFLILDEKLNVMAANEAFYRTFDASVDETERHPVFKLGNGQWAGKHLRKLLLDILPKETFFRDFEVDHVFPFVGRKIMMLNARRVQYGDGDMPMLIILAMEDVTKQRAIEIRLAEYARELEEKVTLRTKELTIRIEQLESFTKIAVERELRMIDLKKEIDGLKKLIKSRK